MVKEFDFFIAVMWVPCPVWEGAAIHCVEWLLANVRSACSAAEAVYTYPIYCVACEVQLFH